MSLPSPMILCHPLRLPFSLLIPLSVPLHLTTPPRTRPLAALLRSLWRSKIMLQLWGYFANQGTTNFSLRLAGIRRGDSDVCRQYLPQLPHPRWEDGVERTSRM